MADNLNEQELQALFRKHLPMKQLPPEFADHLKKQVLAEVAATLAVKPAVTVVTEETAATPVMNAQERVTPRKAPRSVRVQSTVSWLDWFREHFRLTPSMAMAGAMLLALFAIIVWSIDIIPGLRGPFPNATVGTGAIVLTIPASTEATATAIAVAEVVPSPSGTTPAETATPEPPPAVIEESETSEPLVVTANPSDDSVTPGASNGPHTEIVEPTDTTTPSEGEQDLPTVDANAGAPATDVPSATPTRSLRSTSTAIPDNTDTATPEPTVRLSATPTSVTLIATATTERGATATPNGDPIKRPLVTPTATSLALPAATATKPPVNGPVLSTTFTPFVPTPTPTPTPSSTLVLIATSVPTVSIVPWRSPTPTFTETPLPTPTDLLPTVTSVLPTPTPTETDGPVLVPTDTNTPVPTPTNTRRPTATATATVVPPTNTRVPTATPVPTDTPSPTATIPVPTATNTPLPTPTPTNTPLPTATPTDTPWPTATPTDTPLPTATPTDTPWPTATPTDTPLPTATPTNAPPVINGEPVTSAVIDTDYLYVMTATDDGPLADLRFDVLEKPAWLQFEFLGNGYLKLYGHPTTADVGEHAVKIQVHDAANNTGEINFVITVAPSTALGPFADTAQETDAATIDSSETVVLGASTTISSSSSVTETSPAPDANGGN